MDLESKSVKELRELARLQGLSNYSKLTKEKLIRLLTKAKSADAKAAGPKSNPKSKQTQPASAARARNGRPAPARKSDAPPSPGAAEPATRTDVTETQVEDAKYALAPPGQPEAVPPAAPDLGEDIDSLPPLAEPLLCLLPQKPGVLHAYWVLDHSMLQRKEGLRLRLTRLGDNGMEVMQEFAVTATQGHWYLHLPANEDPGEVYLQLGHYTSAGEFVTALRRGTVRVPTLGAVGGVDTRWWFSDDQFREMYLRAGGYVRGARLGWAGPAASSR